MVSFSNWNCTGSAIICSLSTAICGSCLPSIFVPRDERKSTNLVTGLQFARGAMAVVANTLSITFINLADGCWVTKYPEIAIRCSAAVGAYTAFEMGTTLIMKDAPQILRSRTYQVISMGSAVGGCLLGQYIGLQSPVASIAPTIAATVAFTTMFLGSAVGKVLAERREFIHH